MYHQSVSIRVCHPRPHLESPRAATLLSRSVGLHLPDAFSAALLVSTAMPVSQRLRSVSAAMPEPVYSSTDTAQTKRRRLSAPYMPVAARLYYADMAARLCAPSSSRAAPVAPPQSPPLRADQKGKRTRRPKAAETTDDSTTPPAAGSSTSLPAASSAALPLPQPDAVPAALQAPVQATSPRATHRQGASTPRQQAIRRQQPIRLRFVGGELVQLPPHAAAPERPPAPRIMTGGTRPPRLRVIELPTSDSDSYSDGTAHSDADVEMETPLPPRAAAPERRVPLVARPPRHRHIQCLSGPMRALPSRWMLPRHVRDQVTD